MGEALEGLQNNQPGQRPWVPEGQIDDRLEKQPDDSFRRLLMDILSRFGG